MKSFFIGNKEIKLPIIQGGMGVGISLSGLASAVANEGGIGVISCAGLGLIYRRSPGDYLKNCIWGLQEEIRKAKEKTKGLIGVNIMVALTNFGDMVRTTIAEKADVIFAGAGLPLDLPSYLTTDSNTLLVPIVSSARAAKLICEKWDSSYQYLPDAIVVEGPKAGGHLGFKKQQIEDGNFSLEQLIPEVVAIAAQYAGKKNIPIIAAGGITNGDDINRFIELGAAGVQLGSVFVCTDECDADDAKFTGLRNTVIFGGVNQRPQVDELKRGTDILIATPGRLLDLISQQHIKLDHIKHFVLDEADRMLDMGFIHDIKRLLPMLPKQRQTLCFSATMPAAIATLSKTILNQPIRVEVAPASSVVDAIDQRLYLVEKIHKGDLLFSLLKQDEKKSVLVFSRTKHGADKIVRILNKKGIDCEAIHGNKTQGARQRALSNFKAGKTRVIIATDIAARGIDISNLEMVINYDLPDVAETYVHRIGRTGRAGNNGTALTFCSPDESMMIRDIQKLTGKKLQPVSISA